MKKEEVRKLSGLNSSIDVIRIEEKRVKKDNNKGKISKC